MLDPVRSTLLSHMGLGQWQLRRPELLTFQGEMAPRVTAAEPQPVSPGLQVWGPWQPWIADMVRVIGLDVSACHRLLPEQWEQESRCEGVLLLAEPPHQGRLQATYWLDGRQGKRALWQQLCRSGWLKSEPVDADY